MGSKFFIEEVKCMCDGEFTQFDIWSHEDACIVVTCYDKKYAELICECLEKNSKSV